MKTEGEDEVQDDFYDSGLSGISSRRGGTGLVRKWVQPQILQVPLEHPGVNIRFAVINVCLQLMKEVREGDKDAGVITL